jgi:uncharacterized tellurite resistance protein B-like protein
MRKYSTDSPEAIARILTLSMLIDGSMDETETAFLETSGIRQKLGVSLEKIDIIVRDLYEDLDMGASTVRTLDQRLTAGDLWQVVREISDPNTQQQLLISMMHIALADNQISAGEARLLREALTCWTSDEGIGNFPIEANFPRRRLSDREAD